MLRKIRIIAAWVVFILALLLVLDLSGALHRWLGWIARVQLIPAILAVNIVALVVVVVLTLLFGRLYCSTLCPLGIMQDGISWASARRKGKKARFRHTHAPWTRWLMLFVIVSALFAGASFAVSLLDPWGTFGRIAENFFSPLWRWGNNALAWMAERVDSYAFYPVEVYVKNWIALGTAAVWLVGIALMAWWRGRLYCNSICPVGTVLGVLSRWSVFRPVIDESRCTQCGVCEKVCKSECVDSKAGTIDRSRCVVCFDCIDKCKFDAIRYTACKPKVGMPAADSATQNRGQAVPIKDAPAKKGLSRRNFFSVAALAAAATPAALKAQQVERILMQVDGGLADIADKKRPDRKTPITPPGSQDARHMSSRCVACQLCVSACPNNVLVPSSRLATLLQPEMTFERGYCRPECVECSEVCPSGAIERITAADKTAISVGNAYYDRELCVVTRDGVPCTECERHCPTRAITLVPIDPEAAAAAQAAPRNPWERRPPVPKIPTIDTTLCIGCGACEHLCPSRPLSAIRVEGNVTHHKL